MWNNNLLFKTFYELNTSKLFPSSKIWKPMRKSRQNLKLAYVNAQFSKRAYRLPSPVPKFWLFLNIAILWYCKSIMFKWNFKLAKIWTYNWSFCSYKFDLRNILRWNIKKTNKLWIVKLHPKYLEITINCIWVSDQIMIFVLKHFTKKLQWNNRKSKFNNETSI